MPEALSSFPVSGTGQAIGVRIKVRLPPHDLRALPAVFLRGRLKIVIFATLTSPSSLKYQLSSGRAIKILTGTGFVI